MENKTQNAALPAQAEIVGRFGLTSMETSASDALATKFPAVAQAAKDFVLGYDEFGRRTMTLIVELRKSPLNDRERVLLLRGQGVLKQRISFLKRLWLMENQAFKKLEEGKTSLKAAVAAEREKAPSKFARKKKNQKKEVSPVPPVKFEAKYPAEVLDAMQVLARFAIQGKLLGGWIYANRADGHDTRVFVTRVKYESKKE